MRIGKGTLGTGDCTGLEWFCTQYLPVRSVHLWRDEAVFIYHPLRFPALEERYRTYPSNGVPQELYHGIQRDSSCISLQSAPVPAFLDFNRR